jgi:thiamine-phosphate pyrophosphorylase
VIRYLISDGSAGRDRSRWLSYIAEWMERGVDFVQIRERDLPVRELADLTRAVVRLGNPHGVKILVNDRADVAIACGADGVHLRDGSVSPMVYSSYKLVVSVACHNLSTVSQMRGANFILLSPIFEPLSKTATDPALGVGAIREATGLTLIPILALGGATELNAPECVNAGAAGIAGIDYFVRSVRPNRFVRRVPL